jgi:hypothetical protein
VTVAATAFPHRHRDAAAHHFRGETSQVDRPMKVWKVAYWGESVWRVASKGGSPKETTALKVACLAGLVRMAASRGD